MRVLSFRHAIEPFTRGRAKITCALLYLLPAVLLRFRSRSRWLSAPVSAHIQRHLGGFVPLSASQRRCFIASSR